MVLTWDAFWVWLFFLVFVALLGIGLGAWHFFSNSTSNPHEVYKDFWDDKPGFKG